MWTQRKSHVTPSIQLPIVTLLLDCWVSLSNFGSTAALDYKALFLLLKSKTIAGDFTLRGIRGGGGGGAVGLLLCILWWCQVNSLECPHQLDSLMPRYPPSTHLHMKRWHECIAFGTDALILVLTPISPFTQACKCHGASLHETCVNCLKSKANIGRRVYTTYNYSVVVSKWWKT